MTTLSVGIAACTVPPPSAPSRVQPVASRFGYFAQQPGGSPQFVETYEIPLVPGTEFGWWIQLRGAGQQVGWREEMTLSAAPLNPGDARRVQPNVLVREGVEKPVDGWIGQTWLLDAGDPVGQHSIKVYVNNVLVETFRFHTRAPVASEAPPAPAPPPPPVGAPGCVPANQCCKVCSIGQAGGNTCISRDYTCHVGRGCACDAEEICPY